MEWLLVLANMTFSQWLRIIIPAGLLIWKISSIINHSKKQHRKEV